MVVSKGRWFGIRRPAPGIRSRWSQRQPCRGGIEAKNVSFQAPVFAPLVKIQKSATYFGEVGKW
jgi:hypothetical protein